MDFKKSIFDNKIKLLLFVIIVITSVTILNEEPTCLMECSPPELTECCPLTLEEKIINFFISFGYGFVFLFSLFLVEFLFNKVKK